MYICVRCWFLTIWFVFVDVVGKIFQNLTQFHTWNLGSVFLLAIGEIIIVVSLYCFPYFFVIFVIYLEYYNCNLYHTASFTAFFWVFLEVYATFDDSFIGSILVSLYFLLISIFLLFCASMLSLNLMCTGEEAGNNGHVHGSKFPVIFEQNNFAAKVDKWRHSTELTNGKAGLVTTKKKTIAHYPIFQTWISNLAC